MGAANLISNYCGKSQPQAGDAWTVDAVRRDLARHMENNANFIASTMTWLQKWFIASGILLGLEIACWVIDFLT